jgi:flagellar hook-associated protein 1 FlgK
MSLNAALRTATSGLNAAQMGLRAVSDNIANVNTPGYVRKTLDQRPLVVAGQGMGVQVAGTKRITDQYLTLASQTAAGEYSRYSAYSQYMDTIQGLYGDPASDNFFFKRLDTVFSGFTAAANDPASALLRSQAVSNVQDFLNDAQRINTQLTQLNGTMDTRIGADVSQANDLLQRITELNSDIIRAKLIEQDASGAENIQAQLVDQLAGLIGVRVSPHAGGGVDIRSPDGLLLAGDGYVTLKYNSSQGAPGYITAVSSDGGAPQPLQLDGGEVRGLLDLRNTAIPEMSDQLGEFVERTVSQLNAAHNASSAVPAPATLTGRDTGLDLDAAASGFTGQSTLALVDSAGVIQRKVTIDFDAMTFSVNGGPATGFSAGTFDTDLTAALGGMGSASFSNGALSINASGGLGVAIDEGTSQKAGKAFSHFFGLNDLIRSSSLGTYDTGLTLSDAHGFNPGDTITMRLSQPDGKPLRDVTVTVPGGGTMADLLSALNNTTNGVGLYGSFSLDSQGRLSFTGTQPANADLSMVRDETSRGTGGPSFSKLFGIGDGERASRATQYKLDPAITSNATKLAFAHLDLDVAAGAPSLRAGDARGALALAGAGDVNTNFGAAGGQSALTMTLSRYASEFSGSIARQSADAQSRADAAEAVKTEADARRQSVEGVNLDEELVNLTTYQQAFNASARMIQAAKELFDVLTNMI